MKAPTRTSKSPPPKIYHKMENQETPCNLDNRLHLPGTLQAHLLSLVSEISPYDLIEKEHIRFAAASIKSNLDASSQERSASSYPKLSVYAVWANAALDQVVLFRDKISGHWLPLKAFLQYGESPQEALTRQSMQSLSMQPELFFQAPLMLTLNKSKESYPIETEIIFWYVLKEGDKSGNPPSSDLINSSCWFGINKIPFQKAEPHMKRFVQKLFYSSRFNSSLLRG